MNCAKVKDQLGAYLDGELKAAARKQVDEHLPGCISCQAELARAREFDQFARAINTAFDEPAPPGFATRVANLARAESLPAEAGRGWSIREWWRPMSLPMRAAIAAAVLLVAMAGMKSGRIVSDQLARRGAPPPAPVLEMLEMTPAERGIMQLSHGAQIAALTSPQAAQEGRQ